MGFPGSSDGKEFSCNAGVLTLTPWLGRSPGEGNGNPLQLLLPGKFHGQKSLGGYSPWDPKELDTTEQLTLHYTTLFRSVAQSCPTLCEPMNRSTPGLPVLAIPQNPTVSVAFSNMQSYIKTKYVF